MAVTENTGRIIYFEPNDLASQQYRFNNHIPDNISWNMEDLSMDVDLQIIIPSRSDCGTVNYEENLSNKVLNDNTNETRYKSLLSGTYLKGNGNYLTDSYTDACYTEISRNGVRDRECLGISNIDITFNSDFYPIVTIKFIDVRGFSLIMPQEQEEKTEKEYHSFFRSIFNFPYPKFILSVKGFYGSKVSFILSVRSFNSSLNSSTGNFEVTIEFIGHMYGLYKDIPMSFLFVAPFIGGENGVTNKYWREGIESGRFVYSDGTQMKTFIEFLNDYKGVSSNIESVTNNDSSVVGLSEDEMKINAMETIKTNFLANLSAFKKIGIAVEGDNVCIIFTDSSIIENNYFSKTIALIEDYNKVYKDNLPYPNYENTQPKTYNTLSSVFLYDGGNYRLNENHSIIQYLKANNENKAYSLIKNAKQDLKEKRCYLYKKNNLITEITNKTNTLKGTCEFKYQGMTQAQVDTLSTYLGFIPSVENIFRMLFAHLDCFMSVFYNTLSEIKQNETNGKRTAKYLNLDIKMTDMPINSIPDAFIPPFPAVYIKNGGKKEMVYPNRRLVETSLVEALLDGAKNGAVTIAENGKDNVFEVVAIPLTSYDYYYGNKNPYNIVLRKPDDDGVTESLMLFIYRLLLKQQIDTSTKENDIKSEAYNFYLSRKKITDKGKAFLSDISTNGSSRLKEILSSFFNSDNPQVITKLALNGNDISYIDSEVPIFIDSIKGKTENTIFSVDLNNTVDFESTKTASSYKGLLQISDISRKSLEKYEDDVLVFADKLGEEYKKNVDKFINLKLDEYFYYPTQGKSRIYTYDGSSETATYTDYSSSVASQYAKDMLELKNKIDNENYSCKEYQYNYVECKYQGTIGHNLFNTIASANCTFTTNQRNAELVIMFLASLPIGTEQIKETYNSIISKNIFTKVSKPVLLYLGGIVYRYRKSSSDSKLLNFIGFPLSSSIRTTGGLFQIDASVGEASSIDVSKFDARTQKILLDYFESNLKSLYSTYVEPLLNIDKTYNKTTNGGTYIKHGESIEENLIKFILSTEYINVCNISNLKQTISLDDVVNFVKEVLVLYDNKEDDTPGQNDEQKSLNETLSTVSESTDVTDADKLSTYCSLKTLYDKWLASYHLDQFKLHTYRDDFFIRKYRFENKQIHRKDLCEFNNFLFVDSFYNDISSDLMINPGKLYDSIKQIAQGKAQMSLLSMMQDITSKNNLRLLSLPVYNNLLTLEGIQNAFTPSRVKVGVQKQMPFACTYVCMYMHEASSKIDGSGTNVPQYAQNGFDMADTTGEITPVALSMFRTPYKESNRVNARVVAFGVTYAKQNQMYFKDISIDMHEPKISDAGIQNLLQLANGGTNNDRITTYATGQDMFSIYSNKSYECTVTMLGCMDIMPLMYFQLNNTPLFKGAYIIQSVKHKIDAGTMYTTFTGVRVNKTMLPFNKNLFEVNSLVKSLNIQYPTIEMDGYVADACVCPPCKQDEAYSNNPISLVNGDRVVFIGDSQIVFNDAAMPKATAEGLGITIEYFGRGSARADHYYNKDTEDKADKILSAPATNMGLSKCNEVYNKLLEDPPKYVIVALGHNGTNGISELVKNLQEKGIKVIVVYMFHGDPVKAKANKMTGFSSEDMAKQYEGIHGDIDVNIIDLFDKTPKGTNGNLVDGVHATKDGHILAGKEIANQIKAKVSVEQTPVDDNQNNEAFQMQSDAQNNANCNCTCNPNSDDNNNNNNGDFFFEPFKGSLDWSKLDNCNDKQIEIAKYVVECNKKYGTEVPPQILIGIKANETSNFNVKVGKTYVGPFEVNKKKFNEIATKYGLPNYQTCEQNNDLKSATYITTINIQEHIEYSRKKFKNFTEYDLYLVSCLGYNCGDYIDSGIVYGSKTYYGLGCITTKEDPGSGYEEVRRRVVTNDGTYFYNDGKKGEISSYAIQIGLIIEYLGGPKYPYPLWYYDKPPCDHGKTIKKYALRVGRDESEVIPWSSMKK